MNNHDIMVRAAAADQVVKKYAQDLDTFRQNASSTADELRASVHGIERGWSGDTYNAFRSEMERELGKLGACLSQVGNLSDDLHEISRQFTLMIQALRKAGE